MKPAVITFRFPWWLGDDYEQFTKFYQADFYSRFNNEIGRLKERHSFSDNPTLKRNMEKWFKDKTLDLLMTVTDLTHYKTNLQNASDVECSFPFSTAKTIWFRMEFSSLEYTVLDSVQETSYSSDGYSQHEFLLIAEGDQSEQLLNKKSIIGGIKKVSSSYQILSYKPVYRP